MIRSIELMHELETATTRVTLTISSDCDWLRHSALMIFPVWRRIFRMTDRCVHSTSPKMKRTPKTIDVVLNTISMSVTSLRLSVNAICSRLRRKVEVYKCVHLEHARRAHNPFILTNVQNGRSDYYSAAERMSSGIYYISRCLLVPGMAIEFPLHADILYHPKPLAFSLHHRRLHAICIQLLHSTARV